jgi:N-acyl homoserine lactone hydrolase
LKVYLLSLGKCDVDKGRVLTPGIDVGTRSVNPVPGFLIQTADGTNIVVDTGMNKVHIEDPGYTFRGRPEAETIRPVMRPDDYIVPRLAELGITPPDVNFVINTHLHFDHCGGNIEFPQATFIVQREHYEFALTHDGFPKRDFDLAQLKYKLIEGEPELFPGIQVVLTPGHTPFHQSILVSTASDGAVLLCADAIYTQSNLDLQNWDGQADPAVARQSADKLVQLARRTKALMLFGHDPVQWPGLRHPPEYYS